MPLDIWTVASVAIGGILTGSFLLAGQWLQYWLQRRSAVRDRSDKAASALRALLLELRQLHLKSNQTSMLSLPDEIETELPRLNIKMQKYIGEVLDKSLRERLTRILEALNSTDAIAQWEGEYPRTAHLRLIEQGDEVLSAYGRHDKVPREPDFLRNYMAAITDYYEEYKRTIEEHKKRKGKES